MKDYEQKHKEDLEEAKSWLAIAKENNDKIAIQILEKFFPELKKSEDEMIRETILSTIKSQGFISDEETLQKCVAWLEKQDEQKPADNIEPKFKVGDWVIDKQGIVHQIANVIENVTYHTYGYDIVGGGYFNDNTEGVRLWTIQDAKEGDVLIVNETIFLFKNIRHNLPYSYCGIDCTARFRNCIDEGGKDGRNWASSLQDIYPATKEQRDLLFQKMKESGYMWDVEKKELKTIEQKQNEDEQNPAWSEEDERILNKIQDHIREFYVNKKGYPYVADPDSPEMMEMNWLKSLKDRVESKQGEQKPIDKVEPKFKVGDWIINPKTGNILQIKNVLLCGNKGNYEFGNNSMPIESVDRYYKRWTIQDAKDGDVLSFNDGHGNDCIELIKSITDLNKDKKIEFWFCLTNNEIYEVFDGICPYTNMTSRQNAAPATKEQRDLLFSKMKEAGYEWNEDKKELKKIEQKSANKREPNFKVGDWIITPSNEIKQIKEVTFGNYWFTDGTLYNIIDVDNKGHLWTIHDAKDGDVLSYRDGQWIFIYKEKIDDNTFSYHTLYSTIHQDLTIDDAGFTLLGDAIIPATKEQRDLLFQKMKEAGYMWDVEKKELKKISQEYPLTPNECCKPAWSEEDELVLKQLIYVCHQNGWTTVEEWLKSLKPNHWKPSEEQMEALDTTIHISNFGLDTERLTMLGSLYNDLKKF